VLDGPFLKLIRRRDTRGKGDKVTNERLMEGAEGGGKSSFSQKKVKGATTGIIKPRGRKRGTKTQSPSKGLENWANSTSKLIARSKKEH